VQNKFNYVNMMQKKLMKVQSSNFDEELLGCSNDLPNLCQAAILSFQKFSRNTFYIFSAKSSSARLFLLEEFDLLSLQQDPMIAEFVQKQASYTEAEFMNVQFR
jgi:hypothetical protein